MGHLPPVTKTIKIRRTRHAGQSWRSNDEFICDVLQWAPSQGRAKAGRPARTYLQQLCADTGCSSEDLPGAMDDKKGWREKVRNIRADGATWWWWWWWWHLDILGSVEYPFILITPKSTLSGSWSYLNFESFICFLLCFYI